MSRRAAVYTLAVRAHRGAVRPLADIDGGGTALIDALVELIDGLDHRSTDGSRLVRTERLNRSGEQLFVVLQHGERGVAAVIVDESGAVRLRQAATDLQLVRGGCLFRLPAAATAGVLAVQVDDGRGIKELLEQGLRERFGARFPRLTLEIEPQVVASTLRDAVAGNRVVRLALARTDAPGARTIAAARRWVGGDQPVRVELTVASGAANGRIATGPVERFLGGEAAALGEIVEFGGIVFDEARIDVLLPDGSRRRFDLERPEQSRPVLRPLVGITVDVDGEPTDGSLLAALEEVIA